ncbi:hypothetical protein [Shewanella surugensis]|uniref:Uncharacterized protein n=1 Tax=Shewanella surugensis TaxID=212020 RepID=A0ABT0L6M7_9GAMM|nr:hypothetical protein [Shewanella surugensis]MCL1123326.1 hypothetical protein [Shewanella surugensis]
MLNETTQNETMDYEVHVFLNDSEYLPEAIEIRASTTPDPKTLADILFDSTLQKMDPSLDYKQYAKSVFETVTAMSKKFSLKGTWSVIGLSEYGMGAIYDNVTFDSKWKFRANKGYCRGLFTSQ